MTTTLTKNQLYPFQMNLIQLASLSEELFRKDAAGNTISSLRGFLSISKPTSLFGKFSVSYMRLVSEDAKQGVRVPNAENIFTLLSTRILMTPSDDGGNRNVGATKDISIEGSGDNCISKEDLDSLYLTIETLDQAQVDVARCLKSYMQSEQEGRKKKLAPPSEAAVWSKLSSALCNLSLRLKQRDWYLVILIALLLSRNLRLEDAEVLARIKSEYPLVAQAYEMALQA